MINATNSSCSCDKGPIWKAFDRYYTSSSEVRVRKNRNISLFHFFRVKLDSQDKAPAYKRGIFLEFVFSKKDPQGDHDLGNLVEFKIENFSGNTYSYLTIRITGTT